MYLKNFINLIHYPGEDRGEKQQFHGFSGFRSGSLRAY